MEIPGYYFDKSKKKYFKIQHNSTEGGKYTSSSVKQEQRDAQISRKRAKIVKRFINQTPFILSEGGIIGSRIYDASIGTSRVTLQSYRFRNLQFEGLMKTRGRLNFDSFRKIVCDEQRLLLSSLNNIYQIPVESLCYRKDQEIFPMLKIHRIDKTSSILRNFTILQDLPNKPMIRTWFGIGSEPSEVELSIEDVSSNIVTKSKVTGSRNESFNNSIYNEQSKNIVVCGSKNVRKFDKDLSKGGAIFSGADALSIESKNKNIYLLGLRNGQTLIIDDRLNNRASGRNSNKKENSVINVKTIPGERVVCSFLGSKVKLYDIRMGFNACLVDYSTDKNVEDIFGERLEIVDESYLMLQNSSICEFFDVTKPNPLKSLRFREGNRLMDSCFVPSRKQMENFIVTDGENIGFYS